jgi:hypothetical protein
MEPGSIILAKKQRIESHNEVKFCWKNIILSNKKLFSLQFEAVIAVEFGDIFLETKKRISAKLDN